jgi:hypothetical protein
LDFFQAALVGFVHPGDEGGGEEEADPQRDEDEVGEALGEAVGLVEDEFETCKITVRSRLGMIGKTKETEVTNL